MNTTADAEFTTIHFIFKLMVEINKLEWYKRTERVSRDKYSVLLVSFLSYEENEVLGITL